MLRCHVVNTELDTLHNGFSQVASRFRRNMCHCEFPVRTGVWYTTGEIFFANRDKYILGGFFFIFGFQGYVGCSKYWAREWCLVINSQWLAFNFIMKTDMGTSFWFVFALEITGFHFNQILIIFRTYPQTTHCWIVTGQWVDLVVSPVSENWCSSPWPLQTRHLCNRGSLPYYGNHSKFQGRFTSSTGLRNQFTGYRYNLVGGASPN